MTITFRTNIGIYTGKGSPLTKEEVDGNFYDLLLRTIALEAGGAFGVDSVSYTGSSITFNWSDSTSSGPFNLPVATFTARGPWTNNTPYFYLDFISVTGVGSFLVMEAHTTPVFPAEFDPAAENDSGDPLYFMIGESVDTSILMEYRGTWAASTGYFVNDVFSIDSRGLFVVLIGHTSGSVFNSVLLSSGNPVYKQIAPPVRTPVSTASSTTYIVLVEDEGRYFRFTAGCEVTFPYGVTFPTGFEIHFRQAGDLPITFIGEDDLVTLNPQRDGYSTATAWKGATVTAKYVAFSTWDLIGPSGPITSE
jgi:hypothetical protein